MVNHTNPPLFPLVINFSCWYHHLTLKKVPFILLFDCRTPFVPYSPQAIHWQMLPELPLKCISDWLLLTTSIAQGVKVPHSSLSMHENEKPSGLIPALSTKTGSMQNTELHHSQLLRGGCLEREVLPPFKTNESRLSFIKKPGSK